MFAQTGIFTERKLKVFVCAEAKMEDDSHTDDAEELESESDAEDEADSSGGIAKKGTSFL